MSERKQYEYRILVKSEANGWDEIGTRFGRTPNEAIEAIAGEIPDGNIVVAVPLRNWHERLAAKRMEPIFELSTPGVE